MYSIIYGPNQCIWNFPGCFKNLLSYINTKFPCWNFFLLMCLSCQAFGYTFSTFWWNPTINLSYSSSINTYKYIWVALSSIKFVMEETLKLGTMNSMGINSFFPYTNLNDVWPISLLCVALYSYNTTVILWSHPSLLTLQTFVNAVSKILLNASTIPLARGWYDVLF